MAAGQQAGLGNPYSILVLADLNLAYWNNHDAPTIPRHPPA
jgi:hypothetical protein